jgi:virulence factor
MKVAVIGLGGIAERVYLPMLAGWEGIELILSSRREAVVRHYQEKYRVEQGSSSLEEVIAMQPQAAIVLTPMETHTPILQSLFEAGIDAYVEKPATKKAEETRALATLADRKKLIFMTGFNRRFAPLHIKARELLSGKAPRLVVLAKNRTQPTAPELFDQLIDDTIHQIDLARFFCGEGKPLKCDWYAQEGRIAGLAITIELEAGGLAIIESSLEAGAWGETNELHGDGQSIYLDAFERLRLANSQGVQVWTERYASSYESTQEGRGFYGEVAHFFECVESRRQPQTNGWDSLKTQELVEGIVEVAREVRG